MKDPVPDNTSAGDAPPVDAPTRVVTWMALGYVAQASIAVFAGPQAVVRASAITWFLFSIIALRMLPRPEERSRLRLVPLAFVILGTLVGAMHCVTGDNDRVQWAIYSALALAWYLAFEAGTRWSAIASSDAMARLLIVAAAGDVALLPGRVANVGLSERSPWGTSLWLGALLASRLVPGIGSKRGDAFSFLVIGVGILAALLSGMRSSVLLSSISMGLAVVYVISSRGQRRLLALAKMTVAGVLALPVLFIAAGGVRDAITEHVDTVVTRLNATLLNREDVVLDEEGGRELEAVYALQEFADRQFPLANAVGFGHGFVFDNGVDDGKVAHVHLTLVAVFLRYGAIGLALLSVLMIATLWRAATRSLRPRAGPETLAWGIMFTAALLVVNALISGALVPPLSWFILGAAAGIPQQRT